MAAQVIYVSNTTSNGFTAGADPGTPSLTDFNNAKSKATPFATVAKAIEAVELRSPTGDVDIRLNAGGYVENKNSSGRLFLRGGFSKWVTVRSDAADKAAVTITPASGTNGAVSVSTSNPASFFRFMDLTIDAGSTGPAFNIAATDATHHDFALVNVLLAATVPNFAGSIIALKPSGGGYNLFLDRVSFLANAGGTGSLGVITAGNSVGVATSWRTVVMRRCVTSGINFSNNNVQNIAGFYVIGCDFDGGTGYGFKAGVDGAGDGRPCTGILVADSTIRSASGHALILGGDSSFALVENNQVFGGNQGGVFKECADHLIRRNRFEGGAVNINAAYIKAGRRVRFLNNLVRASVGNGFREDWAPSGTETGNKSGQNVVKGNRFEAYGSASCAFFALKANSLGGTVCDQNAYIQEGSGVLASIRDQANLTTLAQIRAAWDAFDAQGNDGRSVETDPVYGDPIVGSHWPADVSDLVAAGVDSYGVGYTLRNGVLRNG